MKRREFVKRTVYTTALAGSAASPIFMFSNANAAANPTATRVLVNVMLPGGADFRHLIAPPFSGTPSAYASKYWSARESIHNLTNQIWDSTAKASAWTNNYLPTTWLGQTFGINNKASWLKNMFDQGNVAIVCNVKQSENRRHDHSQLIINSGRPDIANFDLITSGWGGRLAEQIGAANVISVTSNVSVFCNGTDPDNLTARTLSAPNTRNIALADIPVGTSRDAVLSRSLKAYYARRGVDLEMDPHYARVIQHERALRQLGLQIESALAGTAIPTALQSLISGGILSNRNFGQQMANIYDSYLAGQEMQFRIASLEYGGWDTHKDQKARIEKNLEDIFGTGKALDTLFTTLDNDLPGVTDELLFVFTTDFGRQIKSNGTKGTDHGRGNYMLLVGKPVRGGIYGEMFPESEIPRYEISGADIDGRTSFERVLGEVCDWMQPASGDSVFPGRQSAVTEASANIHLLFATEALSSVSGTVTTTDGKPLQGVSVRITDGSGIELISTTNAAGFYSQADIPNGVYDIVPTRAGYTLSPRTGQALSGNDITLDFDADAAYATEIYGAILTTAGTPATGVSVQVANNIGFSTTVITDVQGRFRQPVPNGTSYLVMPQPNSNYSSITPNEGSIIFPVNGSSVEKNFTAVPVQPIIHGIVLTTLGTPAAGITVQIANNIGFGTTVVTDAEGRFSQQVPDGTTYLVMPQPNSDYSSIRPNEGTLFINVNGNHIEKNFTAVSAKPIIHGRILTPAGTPAVGITVQIANNIGFGTTVATDTEGRFSQPVPDGTMYLVMPQPNSDYSSINPNEGTVFINVNGNHIEKNFTAVPVEPIISGMILTTAGTPAAGASVQIANNIGFGTTVVTDAQGRFNQSVPDGTMYLVMPQPNGEYSSIGPNEGSLFINVSGSSVEKNFTAVPVQPIIYGTILTTDGAPAAGVTVQIANNIGFGTTVATDAQGRFNQSVPGGTTYLVMPQPNSDYSSISPNEGSLFINVSGDNVEKNFTAVPA